MKLNPLIPALVAVSGLGASLVLTGCGITAGSPVTAPPVQVSVAAGAQGTFMGGQQPVAGVAIQIYQAGTASYATGASAISGATATTTVAGNFTLPSFTCTSGTYLYLVGTKGTPIGGSPNPNLSLMTLLGECSAFKASTNFLNVNELTSVASVYALSGFMTSVASGSPVVNTIVVGSPASNTQGLINAFAAINKLVNTTNGTLATPGGGNGGTIPTTLPPNATLPTTVLNTLADIMQECINSSGGVYTDTSTQCGKLFANAPSTTGVYPTDAVTAMLNIAQNPTKNTAALNNIRSANSAFQPPLSVNSPPTAFTIGIVYTGGGLSNPQAIAVDNSGNVWAPNKGSNSVTKLDTTGAVQSGSAGFTSGSITAPVGIAIDLSGNAWVSNTASITMLTPTGTGTNYTGNGLSTPKGIAIDSNNQVWVTNTGASTVSAFTNAGTAVSGSPFSGGGITTPASVATSAK